MTSGYRSIGSGEGWNANGCNGHAETHKTRYRFHAEEQKHKAGTRRKPVNPSGLRLRNSSLYASPDCFDFRWHPT